MAEVELFAVEAELRSSLKGMDKEDLFSFAELHEEPSSDEQIELYIYACSVIFRRFHSAEYIQRAVHRTEEWITMIPEDHRDRTRRVDILNTMVSWSLTLQDAVSALSSSR